jgi:shikimate kinase
MILKLKRTPGIYLVGFMGSGKTTVGRMLSREIGWPFADLDEDIEEHSGKTVTEIFRQSGECGFRRLETEALERRVRRVERGNPLVLALGGGAFVREENYQLINNNGVTIWLDCPLEIAKSRVAHCIHRPLAQDPERFDRLFHARRDGYARADYRVAVGVESAACIPVILSLPIFNP